MPWDAYLDPRKATHHEVAFFFGYCDSTRFSARALVALGMTRMLVVWPLCPHKIVLLYNLQHWRCARTA